MQIVDFNATPQPRTGSPVCLDVVVAIDPSIAFDLDLTLELVAAGTETATLATRLRQQVDVAWLPAGRYRISALTAALAVPAGDYSARISLGHRDANRDVEATRAQFPLRVAAGNGGGGATAFAWQVVSADGANTVEHLSWARGLGDWFHSHFDHAARTVISYMLADAPQLHGRVLDVGCGDGIIDLGVALRCRPREMVGVDPFKGYERLPQVLRDNGLGALPMPPNLRFEPQDANRLEFPDDSFDVVLSWGSLEHIAGGYDRALREIRRVLRPGGLFFVHPGLYYSNLGHHLGEFSPEMHFHLKRTPEEVKAIVFARAPRYIDRAGEYSTPEQYWQWYTELNPIAVPEFERELRALDFEPWRVALRPHDMVEYSPELQQYRIDQLALAELYLSCINRKPAAA
jgi:ubiquinone/menaquinone biosynthesis C-methylase UbiE